MQTWRTGNDETSLPFSFSDAAALSGSDAIRILYAGAVRDDGGLRMDGLSLFHY